MNRRHAAVPDRHALLTGQAYAYPTSTNTMPQVAATKTPWRSDSPFENPYGSSEILSGEKGASKKDHPPSTRSNLVSLFSGTAGQQNSAADLEEQNDARLSGLSERIKLLKDVCIASGTSRD